VYYSHEEKLALEIVLSIQKLCPYIIMCTTKFVTNSNPMAFLLSQRIINGKYACWIVTLQEFNLEFVTPKSNKGLALTKLIYEFSTSALDMPINDDLPYKHLFNITSYDPWHGNILTYLKTHKFAPISIMMISDVFDIKPLAISYSVTMFIVTMLILSFIIVSPVLTYFYPSCFYFC